MPFHNTYHFVPATGRVQRDGQTSLVETEAFAAIVGGTSAHPARHDRWVPGTHSGRLICRLDLERPTLVGGAQLPPSDGNPQGPKRVEPYQTMWRDALGQDHTWTGIPGSSLRGMVSAVAEALSQSSLRILEDRAYSVRVNVREHEKALSALGQLVRLPEPAADGSEFALVPVGLPTLETQGDEFSLPTRWRGVFRDFTWEQVLTSYVDGYEPVAMAAGGRQPRLRAGTFLATEQPTSYDSEHPHFYYASLAPAMAFTRPVTEAINTGLRHGFDPTQPALKVKDGGARHFLLGRRLGQLLTPAQWGQLTPALQRLHVRGYLRVLGIDGRGDMPTTKKHEIFIPCPEGKPTSRLPVPKHVLETFAAIGEERDRDSEGQHPFALRGIDHWRCQDGDLVYFDVDDQGAISEISISAVWRRKLGDRSTPGMQSAHDFFDAQAPNQLLTPLRVDHEGGSRKVLTPAELLLGVVEEGKAEEDASARALASRVRVYDAVSFRAPRIAAAPITLKTLSSPKPPSPALYFHSETDPTAYIPKGSLDKDSPERHRPNGRKFYLHHPAAGLNSHDPQQWACRSRAADGRDRLRLSCRPLIPEADNPFWFHLDFDNLSDAELTLLITALRPGGDHRHKLGLGKSLGLGTVRVEIAGLFLVDRQARYGTQALKQHRYAGGWLRGQPTANTPAWAARYPREAAAVASSAGAQDWSIDGDPASQPWWDPRLIDEKALAILNTLGDPTRLQPDTPVHTPLTEQQRRTNPADPARTETETFKWFVANVRPEARKMLPPVEPGQPLPILPYLQE